MIVDVFLLWHVYELTDGDGTRDEEKFIGVFSSEEKAKDAIEQLKGKEGFRDHPVSCFEIHKEKMNQPGWVDGFVTVYHG